MDGSSGAPDSFNPEDLIRSVIALPLLQAIEADPNARRYVIIDINLRFAAGRLEAKQAVYASARKAVEAAGDADVTQGVNRPKSDASGQYVYARLQGKVVRALVELDRNAPASAIYHVWPDFAIRAQIWKSVVTVKADACRRAFSATGQGIVWAVLDSGVYASHPHFRKHGNLKALPAPVTHMDFTGDEPGKVDAPTDECGHGTHVAGIIAGEMDATGAEQPFAVVRERDAAGRVTYRADSTMGAVAGVAPECKLVSYRVLDETAEGPVSNVIAALEQIQEINGWGREIVIHGVNLSVGYDFDAEWFACGQSPVCVEVDRLVRSGVVVVVAAGNTGKATALTINDPGNAELAITVGATHRDSPHTYGVSYFSSKGPTGDGRRKPDLLAPGEKILSAGAGAALGAVPADAVSGAQGCGVYIERSGTSMAAAHVSGIVAGLLSVRREFIGQPLELKKVLMQSATDLKRDSAFQGAGLVDMMRAIQRI
jgi:serine protease AprX